MADGDCEVRPRRRSGSASPTVFLEEGRRMLRSRHVALASTALLGVAAGAAVPSLHGSTPAQAGSPPPLHESPTAKVRGIIADVNPARVERSIRTLAAFGTRHTLSSQTDPVR